MTPPEIQVSRYATICVKSWATNAMAENATAEASQNRSGELRVARRMSSFAVCLVRW